MLTGMRHLSIDVALGALSSGALAVYATGAHMRPAWWGILPAAVWVIYTADHLVDASRLGRNAAMPRHRFHVRFWSLLGGVTGILALLTFCIALAALSQKIIIGGIILGLLSCMHLSVAYKVRRYFPKEISVSLLFALGVWFGPMSVSGSWSGWILLNFLLFAVASCLNLLMIALYEYAHDEAEGHASLVRLIGPTKIPALMVGVTAAAVLGCAIGTCLAPAYQRPVFLIIMILLIWPSILTSYPSIFKKNERYRIFGDAIFLISCLPYIASLIAH